MVGADTELGDAEPLDQKAQRVAIVDQRVVVEAASELERGARDRIGERRARAPAMHEPRQHQAEGAAAMAECEAQAGMAEQRAAGDQRRDRESSLAGKGDQSLDHRRPDQTVDASRV